MFSHRPRTASETALLTKELFRLERCGRYDEALIASAEVWPDQSILPLISELESADAAEILLRCGAVYGFYGHNKQIGEAQEVSKDLLSRAREYFDCSNQPAKRAECENYLALAYWRSGEVNEARVWLEAALLHHLADAHPIRLYSSIIKCLILLAEKKFKEIIKELEPRETHFINSSDNCLKGDYYNHCGLAYKNLGNRAEALVNFRLARHYHLRSGHRVYLGTVENNLAQLYKDEGRFQNAHQAIDNAIRLFGEAGDNTRQGFALDTKALIFLAGGEKACALEASDHSIRILRESVNSAYLAEALMTKSKILLFMDEFSNATMCLIEAADLAKLQAGDEAAKRLIAEFEKTVIQKHTRDLRRLPSEKGQLAEGDLQLVLPASISNYRNYHGVWINNPHLESVGLRQGALAIVADVKVERGDLAALIEPENESVTCGFYDADFGIICVEAPDCEPQLFDKSQVRILGKIVGVCDSGTDPEGKTPVRALSI